MGISEALIIYLAIGAPLGVYAVIRPKSSFKKNLLGILAAHVLFWPIFASLEFAPRSENSRESNYLIEGRSNSLGDFQNASAAIYGSLDHIADRTARRAAFDAFDRFAALSHAGFDADPEAAISVPEIFEMAGHANPTLAAKCLYRKNSAKLKDHHHRAEADLRSFADEFELQGRSHFEIALAQAGIDLHDTSVS